MENNNRRGKKDGNYIDKHEKNHENHVKWSENA
jgi:hypothetical protein